MLNSRTGNSVCHSVAAGTKSRPPLMGPKGNVDGEDPNHDVAQKQREHFANEGGLSATRSLIVPIRLSAREKGISNYGPEFRDLYYELASEFTVMDTVKTPRNSHRNVSHAPEDIEATVLVCIEWQFEQGSGGPFRRDKLSTPSSGLSHNKQRGRGRCQLSSLLPLKGLRAATPISSGLKGPLFVLW